MIVVGLSPVGINSYEGLGGQALQKPGKVSLLDECEISL